MEGRGLSLRRKRSAKPKISAPKQISAPIASALPQKDSSELRPRPPLPSSNSCSSSSNISVPRVRDRSAGGRSAGSAQTAGTGGTGGGGGGGGGGGAGTADYVKRRYSQRITQLPKDFGDVPTLPQIPGQFLAQPPARAPTRANSSGAGEKVAVDLKALQDPHLPAEQYVARLLANASEQDIRDYQHDLSKIKNRTSTDLQYNVYQNRNQFIKISQEADRLKGEMRALRNLMSDLTSTLGQTNAALGIETSDTVTSRKHANRSSIANLEAMWSTHLHELWRRVEGSQKFLPAIPGRHVVHESGRWVELNTATFRPRRRVHLILLNDHLLVACEKKRVDPSPNPENSRVKPGAPQNQLVAERCMPLLDVEISDVGNRAEDSNRLHGSSNKSQDTARAVKVRCGSDSFTYATNSADGSEKASFLAKFRKAAADLRKLLHVDNIDDPSSSPALSGSRNGRNGATNTTSTTSKTTSDTTSSTARGSMLVDVDGRQQSFRWVENQVDELDIDIALQRFEEAVERVDKLRRIAKSNRLNTFIQELVDGKVSDRAGRLAKAILRQLVDTNSFVGATREHTGRLIKLGFEARASEAYLDSRSGVIKTRVGQCADAGNLVQYVYQVSFIYFTLIKNTVKIYQACFQQGMWSAAVRWAKGHVDDFNETLARQVNRAAGGGDGGEEGRRGPGGEAEKRECLEMARAHAELLGEVGIDFRNLVGRGVEGV